MNNSNWAPIRYRDFWDVPRIFLVPYKGQLFLFDCPLDEDTEDYPGFYRVYIMPPLAESELAGSWADLAEKALRQLGDVPITEVRFDPSRRQGIDPSVLEKLAARKAVAG